MCRSTQHHRREIVVLGTRPQSFTSLITSWTMWDSECVIFLLLLLCRMIIPIISLLKCLYLHRPKVSPICFTFESICHGSPGRPPHQSERHVDICPYRQQIRMRALLCACSARPSDALVSICYAWSKQIAFLSGLGVSNSSPAATPLPDNLISLVITVLLDPDKCV